MRPPTAAKPRVLVLAEECNPDMVSVPLVGWSHYRALAKVTPTHLVTQIRNRAAILRAGLVEGRDFTIIDSEAVARPAYLLRPYLGAKNNKGWTVITALLTLTYPYFEHLLWKQLGERIAAGEWDVVHRLIPLSPTTPSPLAERCRQHNIPFVLGPLNGGLPWPRAFSRERRRESEWLSYLRGAYKLMPGYHATWRNASAVLIGSTNTWSQIPRQYQDKCFYMPENAIDPARFTLRRTRTATLPLRVVFVGRLVPYKGPDMLLEAAAPFIRQGLMTVDIVGEGPLLPDLKSLVQRQQLEAGVTFSGWVDHRDVQHKLAQADLLGFPSIREFGGGVVLEAMAVGLPPLVVDYGGPAELVTKSTGFLVQMGSKTEVICRVREVLGRVLNTPADIDDRSEPARRRALELFTWDAKARQVVDLYRHLLGQTPARPHFPMPTPDLPPAAPMLPREPEPAYA